MTQFNIGDTAYFASAGQEPSWITCPECLGSGRLRVILGDDSEVSIACVCCERGYEGSPGKIQTRVLHASVEGFLVTGVETHMRDDVLTVRYSNRQWSVEADRLFATYAEAFAQAEVLVAAKQAEETKRLSYKMKQTRTWTWNVSYYRREIRNAQQTIERMQARLNVAPKNPKAVDKSEEK